MEMTKKLGQPPLRTGFYGHQFMPWNNELQHSLPEAVVSSKLEMNINLK